MDDNINAMHSIDPVLFDSSGIPCEFLDRNRFPNEYNLIYNDKSNLIDSLVFNSDNYLSNFKDKVQNISKNIKGYNDSDIIVNNLEESLISIRVSIEGQLERSISTCSIKKAICYLELLQIIIDELVLLLRYAKDERKITESKYNELIGENFLGIEVIKNYFSSIEDNSKFKELKESNKEVYDEDAYFKIKALKAKTFTEDIAFPQLLARCREGNNRVIISAVNDIFSAIRDLDSIKYNWSSSEIGIDQYVRKALAFRHLAMASLIIGEPNKAAFYLAITNLNIRCIRNDEYFKKFLNEQKRGYAELHKLINNPQIGREILEGSGFNIDNIGQFITRKINRFNFNDSTINIWLVNHIECEKDINSKFSDPDNPTIKGNAQEAEILEILSNEVSQNIDVSDDSILHFLCSDKLKSYIKSNFINKFEESVDDKIKIKFESSAEINSVEQGGFNDLSEDTASENYPTEYKYLSNYRKNNVDGFEIKYPDGNNNIGESVIDFEKRVAKKIIEFLLKHLVHKKSEKEFKNSINSKAFIIYGGNSTVTAILNLIRCLNGISNIDQKYKYYHIDKGAVFHIKINLDRSVDVEIKSTKIIL